MSNRPKLLIIYTGGTIGMIENPVSRALEPFDFNHLIDNVPKIKMLDYEIDNFQFDVPIDSSDMKPSEWEEIARVVTDNYDKYDGFVVLHGTDTMSYTASALSYMLQNLSKPVVITGSQLPIGEVRTDGEENLITSLQICASKNQNGLPMIQEVVILFDSYLWRGNRSTKHSSDNFNAFRSNNFPPLAEIGLTISFNEKLLHKSKDNVQLVTHYGFDVNVICINLFPGISESTLKHLLSTPDLKGVVLKTFGAGNAPTSEWFLSAMREAVDRDIVVVNVSQCDNGIVNPERYVSGCGLNAVGVISGRDLTSEAAITKLMFLFGQGLSSEDVKKCMCKSIAGEMTDII